MSLMHAGIRFFVAKNILRGAHNNFPSNVRRYIVVIADTLLVIILPAAVAKEYECIW